MEEICYKELLKYIEKQINAIIISDCILINNLRKTNFIIETSNNKYFVKVFIRNENKLYVDFLNYLFSIENIFLKPVIFFSYLKNYICLIYYFYDNKCLSNNILDSNEISKILIDLHSIKIPNKYINYRVNILDELNYYYNYLTNENIRFNYYVEIKNYLYENINRYSIEPSIVHMDYHLNNLIKYSNKTFLIDLENISIFDKYIDFVYAAFFHNSNEDLLWLNVINNYFNKNIPDEFWDKIKYFCYYQLIRMIINNFENNIDYDCLVNSIYNGFNIKCKYPKWYIKYKEL